MKNIGKILAGILFTLLLASAASVLAACSSSSAPAGPSVGTNSAAPAETADHGTLNVSFPVGNIRVAINILALKLGYFAEEGVTIGEVNLGGQNALTAINEGSAELDLLTAGFVPDLQAIASGYDLCFIAGTAVEGGAVIAKKGSAANYQNAGTILNIDAVKQAKLGFVRNEASWIVTRQYLLDHGVTEEEIAAIENESSGRITYYGETTETALAVQKGEIELGFLPMEYALLYADAYDFELVTSAGALEPDYVCCREITSPAKLAEKREAFVAYEIARLRAFEYYKQGESDDAVRQNVVKIVSDYSGKEADYVDTYLYAGVTKYSNDPNAKGIASYVTAAWNSGALSGAAVDFGSYDISRNIDTSVYKEALDTVLARDPSNAVFNDLLNLYNNSN
jgi:NitT/TauT family transport system substrate-binding protein